MSSFQYSNKAARSNSSQQFASPSFAQSQSPTQSADLLLRRGYYDEHLTRPLDPLDLAGGSMAASSIPNGGVSNGSKHAAAGASDFVKKLYNMLEDGAHSNIVSWSAKGDSFVVKDMNEFTKTILPKHFKHSNFASFVRQLNKYDFHKVKNPESTESGVYGDHTWEFNHPNFRADMKGELEQIKRKGPAPRKVAASTSKGSATTTNQQPDQSADRLAAMQQQIDLLAQDQHNLIAHVGNLSRDYHTMFMDVANARQALSTQDGHIQRLIAFVIGREKKRPRSSGAEQDNFAMSPEAQSLVHAYQESSRSAMESLDNAQNRRPSQLSGHLLTSGGAVERLYPIGLGEIAESKSSPSSAGPEDSTARFYDNESSRAPPSAAVANFNPLASTSQVHPQAELFSNPVSTSFPVMPTATLSAPSRPSLETRMSSYRPSWTTPPKILLVEDDSVCRKISSRFLEVFGCEIDVATDGVSAVNKMNSEKYDLVFMDIMMPHLDGVSATSLIRQFDPMTPIISMTANSNPQEILTYFSHGMNDILPKPFTKEGLLGMLDKHLLHLKQMQYLSEIPRALGIPNEAIEDAIVSTLNDPSASNPFADMLADIGSKDEPDYVQHLASLVNGVSDQNRSPFKRDHPDFTLSGPAPKRLRELSPP